MKRAAVFAAPILVFLSVSRAIASTAGGIDPPSCLCSFGRVAVPVDVEIPVHPAGGLNTTDLRRLQAVYNIFGEFCQLTDNNTDRVQLLLHGATYTHQYWTFPMNGFQNYSYVAHACAQGQSTFAYDQLGVGLSDHPANSSDVQLPVVAQIASTLAKNLKDGTLSSVFGLGKRSFDKVIALGHSQGSVVLNYVAITQPSSSSIDAMILTGHIHDPTVLSILSTPLPLARDVDPARWGNLDAGYFTEPDRSYFYPPNTTAFSQDVLALDGLTTDVSVIWQSEQVASVYVPAQGFTGPVVEIVGSFDQVHCFNAATNYTPCDARTLQTIEAPFFPDSKEFFVIVREGSGHDLDLDFGAAETFNIFSTLSRVLV